MGRRLAQLLDARERRGRLRLRRIRWENYRTLPNAAIEVRRHLVLVGPNDSGKSSVLRAVNLCLGVSAPQLGGQVRPADFKDFKEPLRFSVVLDDLDDDDRSVFPDEISVASDEVLELRLEATITGEDEEQLHVRRFFPDAGHSRSPSKAQLDRFQWMLVPATRSLFRELGTASSGAVRTLLSGLDLGVDRDAFDAAAKALRGALDGSAALGAFRADLATALGDALPGGVNPDDLLFSSESELFEDPLAGVTLTFAEGEKRIPVVDQSDGIRALTVLTLLGMAAGGAKIVGIDEPEIHLHHNAQRAVAARLRDSPAQAVVVTHSPAVVREMDPLHLVVMGGDQTPRQLPSTASIAGHEAIRRHWIPNLIEPLTSRAVVLVEGPSDRILCERVAELLGLDLNRRSVSLFELDGSGLFERAFGLFGTDGFNVPTFGLLDEDAREQWAKVCGISLVELDASPSLQVCSPDLEGLYVDRLGPKRIWELLEASGHFASGPVGGPEKGSDVTAHSPEPLADFCRHRKRKVRSALALAAGLTATEAESLTPIVSILRAAHE